MPLLLRTKHVIRQMAPSFGRMVHVSAMSLTMMRVSSMHAGIALDDVVLAAATIEGVTIPMIASTTTATRASALAIPLPRSGATTSLLQPLMALPLIQTAFNCMIEERALFSNHDILSQYYKVAII
jgi:hypothetical protein